MEPNEIIEGNKILAEFVGMKATNISNHFETTGDEFLERFQVGCVPYDEANFYYSWHWLIPIVEKIESIYDEYHGYFGVHIYSNSCTIQGTKLRTHPENPHYAYFVDHYRDTKLQATWIACVEFIKWYTDYLKK